MGDKRSRSFYVLAAFFTAYVLFLWATREGVLHPDAWSLRIVGWLSAAALLLMIGSFVVIAQFTGSPPYSTYVPAHVEDGKLVPGTTQR